MTSSSHYEQRLWDVAVIGAGMGGCFAARALSDAGRDVLLIECGNEEIWSPGSPKPSSEREIRLSESQWPTTSTFEIDGAVDCRPSPLGVGVGGSTNLYAAALERFEKRDIDSHPDSPHPTGGWAFSYDELLPYYERAEQMLHVCGTPDPLSPDSFNHISAPPPLGPRDSDLFQFFQGTGLHPYRLHVGIRYRPGCDECLGIVCQKNCRADARSVLAESPNKATIMARSEVLKLESNSSRVTLAIVRRGDEEIAVRAKVFVIAAGAVHTPKLLLRSRNDYWPHGLANRSGLVGRNLMFHASQTFALWPSKRLAGTGPRKSIMFRDFYEVNGLRCGAVQSTGFEVRYGELLMHLYDCFDHSLAKKVRIVRPLLRVQSLATIKTLGPGTIFACLIEDLPYPENRVLLDENEADGVRLKYTIKNELRDRVKQFRQLLIERLKGRRMAFLSRNIELNYAHPCGTCVMSNNPYAGVVDRDCRAHGITNLFVTDASFMPTSAAVNPSLTIAANALRVSSQISRLLARQLRDYKTAMV